MNQSVYDAIGKGQDPRRILQDWQARLRQFETVREQYLLYK